VSDDRPRSALELRLVLAAFGFVAFTALAAGLFWAGLRVGGWVAAALAAVVAVVNMAVVQYRRVQRRHR